MARILPTAVELSPRGQIVTAVALALLTAACTGAEPTHSAQELESHRQAVLTWREDRLQRLVAPDSWLSVVGLYWLDAGQTTFGAGGSADVIFPPHPTLEGEPGVLGTITLSSETLTLDAAPGATIISSGEPVSHLEIVTDQGENTSYFHAGPFQFHLIERQGRFGLRLKDLTRAERLEPPQITHFPIDYKWRVNAHFEPYDPPRTLAVPTILGTVNQSSSPGALIFEIDGREHRLETIDSGERLMLVFADQTSGKETYGGGRYIYTPKSDPEGYVTIDFNTAYNPPCVFTAYATCFLPPKENRLDLRLEAGEKMVEGYIEH